MFKLISFEILLRSLWGWIKKDDGGEISNKIGGLILRWLVIVISRLIPFKLISFLGQRDSCQEKPHGYIGWLESCTDKTYLNMTDEYYFIHFSRGIMVVQCEWLTYKLPGVGEIYLTNEFGMKLQQFLLRIAAEGKEEGSYNCVLMKKTNKQESYYMQLSKI